jgi:hypothetical protein
MVRPCRGQAIAVLQQLSRRDDDPDFRITSLALLVVESWTEVDAVQNTSCKTEKKS